MVFQGLGPLAYSAPFREGGGTVNLKGLMASVLGFRPGPDKEVMKMIKIRRQQTRHGSQHLRFRSEHDLIERRAVRVDAAAFLLK